MTMLLHGLAVSHNSRKVLAVARHLGIDLELRSVDLIAKENLAPAFLALNPNGLTPVLVDGDFVLWESGAIMVHLASTAADPSLWPEGRMRSEILRWLFWHTAHWDAGLDAMFVETVVKGLEGRGPPDPVEVDRGRRMVQRFAPVLDAQLAGRRFVLGDSVSLADYALASTPAYRRLVDFPLDGMANIQRWLETMADVPAWRDTEPDWSLPPA